MLTNKQLKFADGLVAGKSAAQSALCAGYSEKSASSIGCRLARDPRIQAHIARIRQAVPHKPTSDPLEYLRSVMNDPHTDMRLRVRAAEALLPYTHAKQSGGKKQERANAAKGVAKGNFKPGTSPSIVRLDDHR